MVSSMKSKKRNLFFDYLLIFIIGFVLLYPIIWMFFSTFKTNEEIFGSFKLLPESFSFQYYIDGWKGSGKFTYAKFFLNTFIMVVPTTLLTVLSATFVAYGFARFNFPGKKFLFILLLAMMMLPNAVVIIPRYTLYNKFHWVDSYMPFYAPAVLCCNSFFPYMIIQFLRGIPRELDESAYIDGCGTWTTLWKIICPVLKPAIVSCALFQFMWVSNDFMGPLLYVQSNESYPVSIFLKMSMDETGFEWNKILAMSIISIIPSLLVFFLAQDSFVEGIVSGGVKG